MTFEIFKAFPPNREGPVAELNARHDGGVDYPAEVALREGELRIAIFTPEGRVAWDYALEDFLEALQRAARVLADS